MKRQSLLFILILSISFFNTYSIKVSSKLKNAINNQKLNHAQYEDNSQQINSNKQLGYQVVRKIPRDLSRLYYTYNFSDIIIINSQGFKFFDKNTIVESSGLYGESVMHFLDANTFEVQKEVNLAQKYFGEGCAVFTNKNNKKEIHQMTWRERKIFVYDANNFTKTKEFEMPKEMKEGWGLCTISKQNDDGYHEDRFLATDGSNNIFEIDPNTWSVISKTPIKNQNGDNIFLLNDLEIIHDNIFVNVYLEPTIVQLDKNLQFKRAYNFEELRKEVFSSDVFYQNGFSGDQQYCLNGIAYNQATDKVYITGKKWPTVYEIEFYAFN